MANGCGAAAIDLDGISSTGQILNAASLTNSTITSSTLVNAIMTGGVTLDAAAAQAIANQIARFLPTSGVTSVNGRTGVVVLNANDIGAIASEGGVAHNLSLTGDVALSGTATTAFCNALCSCGFGSGGSGTDVKVQSLVFDSVTNILKLKQTDNTEFTANLSSLAGGGGADIHLQSVVVAGNTMNFTMSNGTVIPADVTTLANSNVVDIRLQSVAIVGNAMNFTMSNSTVIPLNITGLVNSNVVDVKVSAFDFNSVTNVLKITQTDSSEFTANVSSLAGGGGTDIYVQSGSVVGTDLKLVRNDSVIITVDMSSLAGETLLPTPAPTPNPSTGIVSTPYMGTNKFLLTSPLDSDWIVLPTGKKIATY